MLGSEDPTKYFIVQKMLEGLSKLNPKKDRRLPITPSVLRTLLHRLPFVCKSLYESKLFSAAFSLAFHGFLRVGEITATSADLTSRVLSLDDVKISSDKSHLRITIRSSKTDQRGQGVTLQIAATHDAICPVQALLEYLHVRPVDIKRPGPLFCHINGQPLTRYQFSAVLKKALAALGGDYSRYQSHSFRIGAATAAAAMGVSVDDIKRAGRWSSDAFKTYIRLS